MRIPPALASHLPKFNLVTLCLAAAVFWLPWTQIECSGRMVATQSGLESVYSGATLSDDLQKFADQSGSTSGAADDSPDFAYLVGEALLLTAGGIALSIVALVSRGRLIDPGLLAGLSLLLLLVQVAIGFPVDRWVKESQQTKEKVAKQPDPMALMMGAAMSVTATRTNWFYLELILLGAPAAVFAVRLIPEGSREGTGFELIRERENAPGGEA